MSSLFRRPPRSRVPAIHDGRGVWTNDRRYGARRHRRRHAGRHGRSEQRRAHRKSPHGRHRQYRSIQDRQPQSRCIVVTFTLPGFSTVKRDGIQLSTDFTANVNADLKVGSVEETITVSGASPLVDIQSASRQTVLTREVLDTLADGSRSIQAAGVLIPGVTMSATVGGGRDVGGSTKLQQPGLTFHGNGQTIQRWDGLLAEQRAGHRHRRRDELLRERRGRAGARTPPAPKQWTWRHPASTST